MVTLGFCETLTLKLLSCALWLMTIDMNLRRGPKLLHKLTGHAWGGCWRKNKGYCLTNRHKFVNEKYTKPMSVRQIYANNFFITYLYIHSTVQYVALQQYRFLNGGFISKWCLTLIHQCKRDSVYAILYTLEWECFGINKYQCV